MHDTKSTLKKRTNATKTKAVTNSQADSKDSGLTDQAQAQVAAGSEPDSQRGSPLIKLLYAFVTLTIGIFLYLYPETVTLFIDSFLGLSESQISTHWEPATERVTDIPRRDAVVAAFKHAWLAYERDAMGWDEYHPLSREGTNLTEAGGIGYTVVDSLDSMLLMGLTEEYDRARKWVENSMDFDRDGMFSNFETTIRVLGGLLSAYHLSGNDSLYLERAVDLADRMLPAFDTPSGLPFPRINLKTGEGGLDTEFNGLVSTAEAATLQLEYRYLSQLTKDPKYWQKVEKVMATIKQAEMPHGLASIFMTLETGTFIPSAIRMGSRGDSYYEYLLKQYLQTNSTEDVYKGMYSRAIAGVHTHLIQKSASSSMIYTAELIPEQNAAGQLSWRLTPKQDHLVCFFGGHLMLGAVTAGAQSSEVPVPPRMSDLTEDGRRDWNTGVALVQTCMDTHDTATGLAPEIVHFRIPSDNMDDNPVVPHDWYIKGAQPGEPAPYDARYILRPETVESLFLAYRLTGDNKYREFGWRIFQSIERHCRVESGGYASIINVDEVPAQMEDKMETFLLSETFKYLYLLFDDEDVLPLSQYVFNTEAHPLPIFDTIIQPELVQFDPFKSH